MPKVFAVVRPESRELRGRTYALAESLGYDRGHGLVLPAGAPDDRAASWANQHTPDLLILPYHLHRDRDGNPIDGIGVALQLGPHYEGKIPILMVVSGFSMESRLESRLAELRAARPAIWRNLVVFAAREIGSHRLTSKILRVAGKAPSSIPSGQEMPTVRHGPGYRRPSSGQMPRVPPLQSYRSDELRSPEALADLEGRVPPQVIEVRDVADESEPEGPKNSGYFSKKRDSGETIKGAEGEDPDEKSGT